MPAPEESARQRIDGALLDRIGRGRAQASLFD
jgi:hypothetical protein